MICKKCNKICYATKDEAIRAVIGMIRTPLGPRPRDAHLNIYECPHKKHIWHIADTRKEKTREKEELNEPEDNQKTFYRHANPRTY